MYSKHCFVLFCVVSIFNSCKQPIKTKTVSETTRPSGKELSQMYCAACHQYPNPELLDKETWKNFMLPRMGYMYGIYASSEERETLFEPNEGGEIVKNAHLFPEKPTIELEDWEAIQNYYLDMAPASLPQPALKKIPKSLKQFDIKIPKQKMQVPSSTMAQFSKDGTIYLGDAMTKSFSVFSNNLELLQTGNVQEGAVAIHDANDAFWLTVMGSFSPTDAPLGMLAKLPKKKNEKASVPIRGLQRPVHSAYGDLDSDGDTDIVVCEFGKWTGALSLFKQASDGSYTKNVLHPFPGATKVYLQDMNNDGFTDIVALFAQADEGIDIFYNDGKANFKRTRVLQFSPSMGSSYFNLIDFNNDGKLDIIYTAGDNADYKPVMKPWHGVYVFVQTETNQFQQKLFLHLNGAYNAIANDFDHDGDTDIAAISFFPDWEQTPEESFVYYENNGKEGFTLSTFPEVNKGRWVVMDASDYDNDGDVDLILGSLAFEVVPKLGYVEKWMQEGIPFVVLENTFR